MFKKSKSTLIVSLAILLLTGIVGVLVFLPKIQVYWSGLTVTSNSATQAFLIKEPISREQLAQTLVQQKIIDSPKDFFKGGSLQTTYP